MEALTLQSIIAVLNLTVFFTLIIQTSRRKRPPLWLFAVLGATVTCCIIDAISRQSFWPVLTAVIMSVVWFITLRTRLLYVKMDSTKRYNEANDILRQQEEDERKLKEDLK